MPANNARDTMIRHWELLKKLPTSGAGKTVSELTNDLNALSFKVSKRQVERDRLSNEPTKVYRGVLTKRRTYWDALSRGDKAYAERIFPGADHQKNAEAMKTVSGWKDKAKQLRDTEPR